MGKIATKPSESLVSTTITEMLENAAVSIAAGVEKGMSVAADRMVCDNYIGQNEELSEEEKKERIDEYLSQHCEMEKLTYLTGKIGLKCTLGQKEDVFMPEDHNVAINGEQAIASTDCKVGEHINGFGICMGSRMIEGKTTICKPKIAHGKWLESCTKMKVGDAEAVNENSYLICTRYEGARIYPVLFPMTLNKLDTEARIQYYMTFIGGEEITSYTFDDMKALPTVEILARMIYQEDHVFSNGRQNAIIFTVVNRLCFGGGWLNKGANNNLYGVLTSSGQYQSIFDADKAKASTERGEYNAYRPPTDGIAPQDEVEGWENAKRLAAILFDAVQQYGGGNSCGDEGRAVTIGDMEERDTIINFIEEQKDSQENDIENIIGDYQSFRAWNSKKTRAQYEEEDKIVIEKGANVFSKK